MSESLPFTPWQFLDLLYHGRALGRGFVEIRAFKGKRMKRAWMEWPTFEGSSQEFHLGPKWMSWNTYFGVAVRTETAPTDPSPETGEPGVGDKAHTLSTPVVWVDIDLKGTVYLHGDTDPLSWTEQDLRAAAEDARADVLALCEEHQLPPRSIVYTGHGLHVCWVREVRSTVEDTEAFNRGLAVLFAGDKSVADQARILRLPGSRNVKRPERPLDVEVWHADREAVVFDVHLEPHALRNTYVRREGERFVNKGDVSDADLELIGARWAELKATKGGDTPGRHYLALYVSAWLRSNGYSEGDASDVVETLAQGAQDEELRDRLRAVRESYRAENPRGWYGLKEDFGLELQGIALKDPPAITITPGASGKQKPSRKKPRVATAEIGDGLMPASPGPSVYVAHASYYIDRPVKKGGEIVDWTPDQLTNWVWEPHLKLNYPDGTFGERGHLTVNGVRTHEAQIEARAWGSRKDLVEAVGGFEAVAFTTNSGDVAKVRQYLTLTYPDLPAASGLLSYGLHEHEGEWLELYEDGTLTTRETPPVFYAGTPVDPGSRNFRTPREGTPEQLEAAKLAISRFPRMITPGVAYALLGYAVASAFAPRITPHLGHRLPFLYVAGERESGKTSGAQLVLELVTGYPARITKAGGMSPYQYDIAHSSANNLLALLDEYRPGEIDDALLRKHHDLGTRWRGAGMGKKDHAYILNAPLVVLGEGFTDDAATKSRGVLYFVRKADRGDLANYSEVTRQPLWAYAAHLHALARHTLEAEHLTRVERAQALALEAAGGTVNPRLAYALTFIAYGLLVLQADVNAAVFTDQVIRDALTEGANATLEGGTEGVTNLELFLQQLAYALAKVTNPEAFVSPSSVAGQLIIRPSLCVDLVKERYREQAAIANVTLFKQYAEQAPYFIPGDTHKTTGQKVIRGCRLALAKIPERCDADLLVHLDQELRQ